MILEKFICGPLETNCYLIGRESLCVIDPAFGSMDLVLEVSQKTSLPISKILLTHSHFDHIADVKALAQKTSASIYVHSLDAPNLIAPGSDQLTPFFPIEGISPHYLIKEGDVIQAESLHFSVLHTPGHSPGSVCYYLKEEGLLFSGDTLFRGTIGNISFPTSDPSSMWKSLKKISLLPSSTRVLPGHGPDTTLENEQWISDAEQLFNQG